MKFRPSKHVSLPKKYILLLGAIILGLGLTLYRLQPKPDKHQPVSFNSLPITYSTDTPDENKPANDYKWSGKPEEPKYIRLSTIQTEGFIQTVGVDQHKQVAVPDNIHIAGWFKDSVRPGEQGLSIIDGHVDGRKERGIFKRLIELKQNDEFKVEMGNSRTKTFRVMKVVSVEVKDAANVLFSQDPSIKNQLNLITCGGNFNQQSGQYNNRIIVISELVSH